MNDEGLKSAAVFKNDKVVYDRTEPGRDLYASAIVIDTVNNDLYWSCLPFILTLQRKASVSTASRRAMGSAFTTWKVGS